MFTMIIPSAIRVKVSLGLDIIRNWMQTEDDKRKDKKEWIVFDI
jgi:hypothetical protein